MECVGFVAAGTAAACMQQLRAALALHSFLIHLLISGPLRSYRSLLPPQPAEWTVVTCFSACLDDAPCPAAR